ncbi:MAG: hypothetical protein DRR19_16270 [Candidatus Parabeggiatoa sp. nov. 1]|nr:MAG: hypothetical protein DRR19_16270 [Gammaproteobacteria bacterium]
MKRLESVQSSISFCFVIENFECRERIFVVKKSVAIDFQKNNSRRQPTAFTTVIALRDERKLSEELLSLKGLNNYLNIYNTSKKIV